LGWLMYGWLVGGRCVMTGSVMDYRWGVVECQEAGLASGWFVYCF